MTGFQIIFLVILGLIWMVLTGINANLRELVKRAKEVNDVNDRP